jgi:hypothetical protein
MTLPQNYIDFWSGNLKDLPDPIDLAKNQKLHITTVINNSFFKLRFELFLSSNAGFAQLGPTRRSQVEMKSQTLQKLSLND